MYFSSAWIMADEHDQILSTEAEDELLTVETDPKEKTPTDVHPDPMSAKYLRPANCETLTTPRVNPEIWDKLSHSVKQQDLRSSSIQKTIATAGAAMCKSIGMLLEMYGVTYRSKLSQDIFPIEKLIFVSEIN